MSLNNSQIPQNGKIAMMLQYPTMHFHMRLASIACKFTTQITSSKYNEKNCRGIFWVCWCYRNVRVVQQKTDFLFHRMKTMKSTNTTIHLWFSFAIQHTLNLRHQNTDQLTSCRHVCFIRGAKGQFHWISNYLNLCMPSKVPMENACEYSILIPKQKLINGSETKAW